MKRVAFLFPGQGSQAVGMGKDFYDTYAEAREVFQEGDEILKRSLSKIVFQGPEEELLQTRNSQVAIYLNSMAILRVLQKQLPHLQPNVCAGHSLGEYSALTATGRVPFAICLPVVQFRAEVMNEACLKTPGTMAAILGLESHQIEAVVKEVGGELWAANFNCPGQIVISGTLKGVERGCALAKERGAKRAIPLAVHGAFHSGLMRLAEEKLAEKIAQMPLQESPIALVMNVTGDYVSEAVAIKQNLMRQVTSSVRWEQGILNMKDVELFVEIGGKVLSGLNKKMGVTAPTIAIEKIADLEQLAKGI